MELGLDFLVFVGALSVAAISPGPGLAAIVAMVLARGAKSTLWFCAGIILGDLVWLSLSLGGLAVVARQIPMLFVLIKWIGVVYLVWLAWAAWHADTPAGDGRAATPERSRLARGLAGLAVTMGNPKAMLFYIALLPNLISAERLNPETVAPLYLAVIVVLSVVFAIYAAAAETARRTMKSARAVRHFNRASATALGGAAVWIASR